MTLSVVLIVPAAYRAAANDFATSQGMQEADDGVGTFVVPLSPDGSTITHYGTHTSAKENGPLMRLLAKPPPEAAPLLAVLIQSVRPFGSDYGNPHFVAVAAANGLTKLPSPPLQ